jgi:hypothetical protein
VGLQRHRSVGSQHRDAVAGANAEGRECGGETVDASLELRLGEATIPIHDRSCLGIYQRAAGEKVEWGERGDHKVRG